MPLLQNDQCQNCGRHSETLHKNGSKCSLCAPALRRCAGCKLTLYCDKTCQKQHRPMHRLHCKDEVGLTSLAQKAGCLKKFNNFQAWCRKETSEISRNAHAKEIPHSKDHFFLVNYPECTGFWVQSSEFPEPFLKFLKLSEDEMTILVLNLELPFPLGVYTIKEDHPFTTLARLLASHTYFPDRG
ncbi:hypothetical protein B0H14DRAFT_2728533 [Mycena olivaceomarginata]|nr:hypothetical protein B0H14DRAFT_2728533 [Mycena olivaceomarginata]